MKVQKVQKFIKKHLYKIILAVFILFMITNPGNKLFKHIIKYKNTLLGKMISVIVILYVSSKNITYGILLGIIFMFSLFIYNKKGLEHFEDDSRAAQELINSISDPDKVDVGTIMDIFDQIDYRYNKGEGDNKSLFKKVKKIIRTEEEKIIVREDDDDEPGTTQGDDEDVDDDGPGTTQGDDDDDDDDDDDNDDNDDGPGTTQGDDDNDDDDNDDDESTPTMNR